ncbi:putative hydrolase [Medicago truncatula]|uniref:2,3-diketo-5-methylthio-1-phosphopentane phosphatase n=1 Tax=Medicago truncatula TaxID=3880 RepID=A0A072TLD3_MEDTR|nr:inorganic pyrophosphatase 2 [Medicago truncatula]KEH18309.1 2,3-diketo-5-methylthio-1-phosphopentane phosphatase [Medicago truncatula]RHN39241.1 putative hydrolase [Medicago truncatula]
MSNNIVVVFDFDKTIIDCDSDNWVIDELGFTDLFNQLLPTMPWNSLMDRMMMEIHSNGKTIEEIEKVLQRIPIHHRIIPAIKSAHALGCDLRIVSDANTFFIETILKNLGISEYFTEINTNPGYVNQQGRLRILPYHDFNKDSHGCILCPPNMCKGLIIDRIQNTFSEGENKRFIYLGDGIGDYCPSLRLREKDFMMPRKNFPVWDLICKDPSLVKAEIHGWCDGEELEQILIQLINKIIIEENAQFISSDCKLQTLSIPVHETLPKALSVRP